MKIQKDIEFLSNEDIFDHLLILKMSLLLLLLVNGFLISLTEGNAFRRMWALEGDFITMTASHCSRAPFALIVLRSSFDDQMSRVETARICTEVRDVHSLFRQPFALRANRYMRKQYGDLTYGQLRVTVCVTLQSGDPTRQ